MITAVYSLIQFSPDPGRQEASNVGVVVFRPEPHAVEIMMAEGLGPNTRKLSGAEAALLEATKRGFKHRLMLEGQGFRDASDLARFRPHGANPFRITEPRQIVVRNLADDVRNLFEALVEVPTGKGRPGVRGARVATRLKEGLRSRDVARLIDKEVDVVVPAFGRRLKVPFAYRNGRYNLIEPVDFALRDATSRDERLAWYAVGGKSIFDAPDPRHGQQRLVVVARLPENQDVAKQITGVLENYKVRCLSFSDAALDDIAADIRSHAPAA